LNSHMGRARRSRAICWARDQSNLRALGAGRMALGLPMDRLDPKEVRAMEQVRGIARQEQEPADAVPKRSSSGRSRHPARTPADCQRYKGRLGWPIGQRVSQVPPCNSEPVGSIAGQRANAAEGRDHGPPVGVVKVGSNLAQDWLKSARVAAHLSIRSQ